MPNSNVVYQKFLSSFSIKKFSTKLQKLPFLFSYNLDDAFETFSSQIKSEAFSFANKYYKDFKLKKQKSFSDGLLEFSCFVQRYYHTLVENLIRKGFIDINQLSCYDKKYFSSLIQEIKLKQKKLAHEESPPFSDKSIFHSLENLELNYFDEMLHPEFKLPKLYSGKPKQSTSVNRHQQFSSENKSIMQKRKIKNEKQIEKRPISQKSQYLKDNSKNNPLLNTQSRKEAWVMLDPLKDFKESNTKSSSSNEIQLFDYFNSLATIDDSFMNLEIEDDKFLSIFQSEKELKKVEQPASESQLIDYRCRDWKNIDELLVVEDSI
jgi:hypothetical protein